MPRPGQTRRPRPPARAGTLLDRLAGRLRRLREALRDRWRAVPVQVLVADRGRRREVAREIRAALRQLRRLLGAHFPRGLRVLVQEAVGGDRPLAGCARVVRHPDGTRTVLVQLALRVGERVLGTDDVLAALAEQCVALGIDQADGPSVIVPLELPPAPPPPPAAPPPPAPAPRPWPGAVVDRTDGRAWPTAHADRRPTTEEIDRWLGS